MNWIILLTPYLIFGAVIIFLLRLISLEREEREGLINHIIRLQMMAMNSPLVSRETEGDFIPFPEGTSLKKEDIEQAMRQMVPDGTATHTSVEDVEGAMDDGYK